MNKKDYSPYSTNKGGMIKAPKNTAAGEPKATKIKTDGDLRSKKRG